MGRQRFRAAVRSVSFLSFLLYAASLGTAHAAQGDCSQPITNGENPTASDCLFILQAAVGSQVCTPECICDTSGGGGITASDALICLKKAVGQAVTLNCPCATTTTSSTVTTSTTTTSSTMTAATTTLPLPTTTLPSPTTTLPVTTTTLAATTTTTAAPTTTLPATTTTTAAPTTTTTIPPATNIVIINNDDPGEGFNDPSPRVPIGGNNGTTLGDQRLNVFEFAADILELLISSPFDIRVAATFDELPCDATSAVLGSAGANAYFRDFIGAPLANTWFPAALADKLRGADLDPGQPDIVAQFNSAIGTTCPFPNVWYYGLDGNAPPGELDLVTVVLHELTHGLGFATIVDLATGSKAGGFDDVFMLDLEDHSTGKLYPDMSDAERVTASTDTGDLHWVGPAVVAGSGGLASGRHPSGHVQMYAPSPQEPGSSVSHFDDTVDPNELMEPSYTGPNHDIGLALEVFDDILWDTIP